MSLSRHGVVAKRGGNRRGPHAATANDDDTAAASSLLSAIGGTRRRISEGSGGGGSNEPLGGDSAGGSSNNQQWSVPDGVGRFYYRLGLLCASQPRLILILTFVVIVYACFPLLTLPIYSTRPQIQHELMKHFIGAATGTGGNRSQRGDSASPLPSPVGGEASSVLPSGKHENLEKTRATFQGT